MNNNKTHSIFHPKYLGMVGALCSLTAYSQEEVRPNILWLTYEDTSPQFIGCYGNEQAKTPNIDKLSSEGVQFNCAFSTGSVSSPSRFCLITGVRTTTMGTGGHRSAFRIPENIKGFPSYLRQAGYYTSNNVKTDYNHANAKAMTRESWDECSNNADWQNRKPGQPFFAVFNSNASHQSRTMTNPWETYEKQVLDNLEESEKTMPGNLEMPAFYHNSPLMQKHLSRVYNSITLTDKEFGTWLDKLEQDGLRDSTIIFCFSDHGEGISRGKGSSLGLGYRVPFIVWIPPMYKHLSPWGSGIITEELVSFEDMAPTILSLAGVKIPDYMEGHVFMGKNIQSSKKYVFSSNDRIGESSELSRSVSDGRYLYTKVFMPFQPFVMWNMYYDVSALQQTIRADYKAGLLNETQRKILEPRTCEYLFDLKSDKWETINLIDKPEYVSKVTDLRNALKNYLITSKDAQFLTEYSFYHSPKTPYELRLDNTLYPAEKVIETAMLCGNGKEVKEKQLQLLNDNNQLVRYWSSIGLLSQSLSRKELKDIDKIYQHETFPPVKLTLSALLFKFSDDQKYETGIGQLIADSDPEVSRMTMHLCISLDETKRQKLLPTVKKTLNERIKDRKMTSACELMRLFVYRFDGDKSWFNFTVW